ncbi:hypothetical protein A2272_01880 [Candidatus Peregrinibacteria bacterium RIFOXYA12_FULL_33_12]|nr:MAG: hypothetical protein A2263_02570 [Candidatus Peregrinibacteria bacterium RIFOXYA2_FULL_33_21]OGJ44877.1 MAG: hypothetical protein A2272_01880 [Candidatus Peregrinibacteria bacterium RIFOXYA12_FULL_33_12]OGJ50042.1 MAG: hypothetical protein A2307_01410 [Candidatus Peregrinibacteria bacterium RIFOXYB2_FULL_33_20]
MHLKENETILKIFRHHFSPFLIDIAIILVLVIPLFIIASFVQNYLPATYTVWLYFILTLTSLGIATYVFLIYWLDKLVVSNQRIMHINWKTLFKKEVYSIKLKDIQNISFKCHGILEFIPFFNYGSMEVESAANFHNITFADLSRPEETKQFITDTITKYQNIETEE